jgi:DNA-binding MarR family transcriptional regulator
MPHARPPTSSWEQLLDEALSLQEQLFQAGPPLDPRTWLAVELTMPQLKVLVDLARLGQARIGAVANALGVGPPTASGIVDRLVRRGLVTRQEDPTDRRVTIARLTPRGTAAVERLFAAGRSHLRAVMAGVPRRDLPVVLEAMRILARSARSKTTKGRSTGVAAKRKKKQKRGATRS